MTEERVLSRRVRLKHLNNRFVFMYVTQPGDTVSEIAEELLGSPVSIDVIRALNPSLQNLSEIQANLELIVSVATPHQIANFLTQAWSHAAETSGTAAEATGIDVDAFSVIATQLMIGSFEAQMP